MKTITKSIDISAPKEKVWDVLLNDRFTRAWYAVFSEGTHAVTTWEAGSKAVFKDGSNSGLVSKIVENRSNEMLVIEHQGQLVDGVEDYDSEIARQLKGARENYHLSETNGVTNLSVECDMDPGMFDSMSLLWDKALQKVKELSEGVS